MLLPSTPYTSRIPLPTFTYHSLRICSRVTQLMNHSMRRNSVKVCIRTRPTQNFAQDNIAIDEEHSTIQINSDRGDDAVVPGGPNNKQNLFKFRFNHVFHNATQTTVYDLFARDTVQGVVDGINGAIMSYGQTGSGKSFTVIIPTHCRFHLYLRFNYHLSIYL